MNELNNRMPNLFKIYNFPGRVKYGVNFIGMVLICFKRKITRGSKMQNWACSASDNTKTCYYTHKAKKGKQKERKKEKS